MCAVIIFTVKIVSLACRFLTKEAKVVIAVVLKLRSTSNWIDHKFYIHWYKVKF